MMTMTSMMKRMRKRFRLTRLTLVLVLTASVSILTFSSSLLGRHDPEDIPSRLAHPGGSLSESTREDEEKEDVVLSLLNSSQNLESSRLFWSSFHDLIPWFVTGHLSDRQSRILRPDSSFLNSSIRSFLSTKLTLWPDQDGNSDRIINQLMYLPVGYDSKKIRKNKKIFLYYGRGGWTESDLPMGRDKFLADGCPVNTCELTMDLKDAETSDVIFFKDRFQFPEFRRNPSQIWLLFLLECPPHTQSFRHLHHVINWTATYRQDSDIVTPYEKYFKVPDDDDDNNNYDNLQATTNRPAICSPSPTNDCDNPIPIPPLKGSMTGKENKVAWFVSNCGARNLRLEYAKELSKYIKVDIFGSCGTKRCPRRKNRECFALLNSTYKYYLAFENGNCRDYITEKFYVNGLQNNLVPIVMGAHPDDYRKLSPRNSFIHVDDFKDPKDLANFLTRLHVDESLYVKYLDWKNDRKGYFVNTYFWCRLCALLHANRPATSYPDFQSWWNNPLTKTCKIEGWRTKTNYAVT